MASDDDDSDGCYDVGFASHDVVTTSFGGVKLTLECAAELTPLDAVLLAEEDVDLTGHKLWPGAHVMAAHLLCSPSVVKKTVVELGCGTGAAGLIAAHCGAEHVLLTDGDEGVISLLQRNVDRSAYGERCATAALRWGEPPAAEEVGRFDLCIAADVVYSEDVIAPLLQSASCLLKRRAADARLVLALLPRVRLQRLRTLLVEEAAAVGLQLLVEESRAATAAALAMADGGAWPELQSAAEDGGEIYLFSQLVEPSVDGGDGE
eukprot:PLAT14039.4.p1 GENE.PLAT14039.4~~PLAT14039.4.p1  ORF type:complete len:263 (+),score=92.20 PLAT14039.4:19-807(+)